MFTKKIQLYSTKNAFTVVFLKIWRALYIDICPLEVKNGWLQYEKFKTNYVGNRMEMEPLEKCTFFNFRIYTYKLVANFTTL